MADWSVGDWVFAYFEEEEYWYPAEIVKTGWMGKFTVRYDFDKKEETLGKDNLDEYSAFAGEKGAECWSDEDEDYYAVTIKKVDGENILVRWDDGSEEWTDLSNLRYAKK
jgi:hypothetical protein